MKGVLTLFDIRFCIALRSWLHPSRSPISVLLQHPDPKWEGKRVVISAGRNEVTVWDIVTVQCVEIFGVKYGDEKLTAIALEAYKVSLYIHSMPFQRPFLVVVYLPISICLTETGTSC